MGLPAWIISGLALCRAPSSLGGIFLSPFRPWTLGSARSGIQTEDVSIQAIHEPGNISGGHRQGDSANPLGASFHDNRTQVICTTNDLCMQGM